MSINFKEKGSGKNVILLHGWGGSMASMQDLQDILSKKGLRVFNLDLPGFGLSKMTKDEFSLDDYVESIKDFIIKQEIFKPALIGHSFGGKVSAAFAIKYPEKISKLILINASGIYPKNEIKKRALYLPSKIFKLIFSLPIINIFEPFVKKLFYKMIVREKDYLESGNLKKTIQNVLSDHLDKKLYRINTPTLLIWSEKDTYTPLWQGQKMAKLINTSRLEVISGAKHGLPLKNPDLIAPIIYNFISK